MSLDDPREIVRIGVAPHRIALIPSHGDAWFEEAWEGRVEDLYGDARTSWIGRDALLRIKEGIDVPRHQEDARMLREVKRLRGE